MLLLVIYICIYKLPSNRKILGIFVYNRICPHCLLWADKYQAREFPKIASVGLTPSSSNVVVEVRRFCNSPFGLSFFLHPSFAFVTPAPASVFVSQIYRKTTIQYKSTFSFQLFLPFQSTSLALPQPLTAFFFLFLFEE